MSKAKSTWLGEADRHARLRKIETLELDEDFLTIGGLTSGDFRSIIFPVPFAGFMTTFAAPRMSRILYSTGEITQRFAKRAVDTILFARTIHQYGFGTPEGRVAARKVHALHAQYDIHPDDFILVGCDPLIFSLDIFDRFGWRALLPKERVAQRLFYDRQARAFGARRPLPKTETEMRAFVSHYFDTQLHYEPQNREMAELALDWFGGLAPRALRPIIRKTLLSVIDVRVLAACGIEPPSTIDRAIGTAVLKILSRRDPIPDQAKDMLSDLVREVYPNGYKVEELGPPLKDGALPETATMAGLA